MVFKWLRAVAIAAAISTLVERSKRLPVPSKKPSERKLVLQISFLQAMPVRRDYPHGGFSIQLQGALCINLGILLPSKICIFRWPMRGSGQMPYPSSWLPSRIFVSLFGRKNPNVREFLTQESTYFLSEIPCEPLALEGNSRKWDILGASHLTSRNSVPALCHLR